MLHNSVEGPVDNEAARMYSGIGLIKPDGGKSGLDTIMKSGQV